MPDISKALKILGWMSEKELLFLAEEAERHRIIVEIGSYYGRSARALGDNTPGRVYAVDRFTKRGVDIFPAFMNNVGDLVRAGKIIPIVKDHATVEIRENPDMVFIDGGHEYEEVKRDILKWEGKIAAGGLMCGHDYTFPGVFQAVQELLQHTVVPGTEIWQRS